MTLDEWKEQLSGNKTYEAMLIAALQQAGDDPHLYFKKCKKGIKVADAKQDEERELLLTHPNTRVRALVQARAAIKSWPLHIARVRSIMAQAKANDGVLPISLLYHGAHTGRYSGGGGVNAQNLPKTGILAEMRKLLISPPGYKLVVVDAAAIEARIVAYLAGQWDLVTKFVNGEEIYCGFAEKVLGYPVRKPRKDGGGIPSIEARMLWARNSIGKIGILGGSYGMGTDRFFEMGAGAFDMDMALKIRDTYRSENDKIVKFWSDMERAFKYVAKYQKPAILERGIRFDSYTDCDVVMTLPNGREVHYVQVKVKKDGKYETAEVYNSLQHCWEYIWGGTLVENCVQAVARDVLVESMLRLEDRGWHTALTVHDELVLVVPDDQADACLTAAIVELSHEPVWAKGLSLGAEGSVMTRYSK